MKPLRLFQFFVLPVTLSLSGCQTPQSTSFAPLNASLEPVPGGGARYFVIINASSQELHNCTLSVYIWNNKSELNRHQYIRESVGSVAKFEPGQSYRFHAWGKPVEDPITERVSGVEIVGHCDEGRFRQTWVNTDSDQLVSAGKSNPRTQ